MNAGRAGFTLLEMLVAIALFALLSLLVQQVSDGMAHADRALADHTQRLKMWQQTMSLLKHDFGQMMPRTLRGASGHREPALLVGEGVLGSSSEGIRFVRGGLTNPQMRLPRSTLATVGYRIRAGYLERLSWPLTDASHQVNPLIQKLMPVDALEMQFYDGTHWQRGWSSRQAIPLALRMTLHMPDRGELERVWLLHGPQMTVEHAS